MSQQAIKTQNLDKVLKMTNTEGINMITERGGKIYRTPFRGESVSTKLEKDDRLLFFDTNENGSDGDGKIHEINYEDLLLPIIDPDNFPIYTERQSDEVTETVIPMIRGSIDSSDGDFIDYDNRNPYIRSNMYIPIELNKKYKFYSSTGEILRIRIFLCDNNKKVILDNWNDGNFNFKEISIGSVEFSTDFDVAKYMIFDVRGNGNEKAVISVNEKFDPVKEFVTIKKINLPELFTLSITDNLECNSYQFDINRDDPTAKSTMFTLRAPYNNPKDSCLRLLNTGLKTNQFVDLRSIRDDEDTDTRGRFEVAIRSYGDKTPVPEFVVGFSDSINGTLINKFTIDPDAKPVRFTKDGVQFRLNNYENNNPGNKELLTINFKDLYDKVEKSYSSLITYNLLVDKVGADTVININANNIDYSGSTDYPTVGKAIDFLMQNRPELNFSILENSVSDIYTKLNLMTNEVNLLVQSTNQKISDITASARDAEKYSKAASTTAIECKDKVDNYDLRISELEKNCSANTLAIQQIKKDMSDNYLVLSQSIAELTMMISKLQDQINNN